jgi:LmbE family N-acetylglucosaminyl deacetylase
MSEGHEPVSAASGTSPGQSPSPGTSLTHARLLVLAPHMDDETLGCGGTLALHSDPSRIHCLFATDGSRSPAPLLPWAGRIDPELPAKRRLEAIAALAELGIGRDNLIFLNLPDSRLSRHRATLARRLSEVLQTLRPELVIAPFRLDVHPDHVILNRTARSLLKRLVDGPEFAEYFIYNRLRLLPGGDIRGCLRPSSLIRVDTSAKADVKMRALLKYETQVTITQSWQDRPTLTQESLRERCQTPEYFMFSDPGEGLLDPFPTNRMRILAAYLAQRFGKRPKDRLLASLFWLGGRGPAK